MLLDIVGYIFMVAFCIFGFIVMLWIGLAAIATFVAVIGAILQDLDYLEIEQTKFEEKVGMSRGHIYNMGENLTSKTLSKIKIAYPELNKDWLLTGKGEMIKSVNTQNAEGNNSINSNINNIEGNVTISHNDFSNLLELQKGYQEAQKELNEILKTAQNQLSESQKQVSDLIKILNK